MPESYNLLIMQLLRWARRSLNSALEATTLGERAPPTGIPKGYDEQIVEGSARTFFKREKVFYNPVQVVNRDLSVQVLRWFVRERGSDAPPIRILEALSASGLRSIRYFKEVPNVHSVIANDMDPNAVDNIRLNVLCNDLSPNEQVIPSLADAIELMTMSRGRDKQFDVIDLDPYGSAAPFLDSAVQAVADGGILAITCTDLRVLCGNSPEICFVRYGATPLKGPVSHEMAVRIVLSSIQKAANRHGRAVVPLVCARIDFYVRVFVRVHNSKSLAQETPSSLALVFQCAQCLTPVLQPLGRIRTSTISKSSLKKRRTVKSTSQVNCGEAGRVDSNHVTSSIKKFSPALLGDSVSGQCRICKGSMQIGGPIWTGALVKPEVAESILGDFENCDRIFQGRSRVEAILRLLLEEVPNSPLFLQLPAMCRVLKVTSPPSASVRGAILRLGYKVSQSHTDPLAVKTDAPPEIVWDILRKWVEKTRKGNGGLGADKQNSDGLDDTCTRILSAPSTITTDIDFSVKKDKFIRKACSTPSAPRFPQNPTRNWGPKARAGKRKRGEIGQ